MSRMHRPDPTRPPDQQDKRSVVAIEFADVQTWLEGDRDEASRLVKPPPMTVIAAAPIREP